MQSVDSMYRRLSSKRGSKKGKKLIGETAGYMSTSLFVFSNDVKMLRSALWCSGGGAKSECEKVLQLTPSINSFN